MPPALSIAELPPGAMIGEFQVQGVLGRGGMGTVYRAVQTRSGQQAAIKVLSAHVAGDQQLSRRFLREAQVVNRIRHPGLIDIFTFGELPGRQPYLVMELLTGEPLADRLAQGPFAFREIVDLFTQVLEALQAAHEAGVIHRDLKPENIYLLSGTEPPQVKILDFGLAKVEDGGPVMTQAGVAMGTPRYMSPEQCRGAGGPGGIDQRSDLYAVGLLLYEAVTGQFPFKTASPVEMLIQHLSEEPVPPSRYALLPASLEALILRALAKDPQERFASAREMAQALRGIAADPRTVTLRRLAAEAEVPDDMRQTLAEGNAFDIAFDKTGALPQVKLPDAPAPWQAPLPPSLQAPPPWTPPSRGPAAEGRPAPRRAPLLVLLIAGVSLVLGVAAGVALRRHARGREVNKPAPTATDNGAAVLHPLPPPLVPQPQPQPVLPKPRSTGGTLVVDTGLADAQVAVDGRLRGTGATVRVEDLLPGKHKVTVTAGKGKHLTKKVDVQAGMEVPLQMNLASRHHHHKGP